jgi:hypothetical protein
MDTCWPDGFLLGWFSTLKLEVIRYSETLVNMRTTRRCIPEDGNFSYYRCEKPIPYRENTTFRKLNLFRSSSEGRKTPTLVVPLERTDLSHWTVLQRLDVFFLISRPYYHVSKFTCSNFLWERSGHILEQGWPTLYISRAKFNLQNTIRGQGPETWWGPE